LKANDGIEKLLSTHDEYREWAEANIYEVPITLPDVLWQASEIIKTLYYHAQGNCKLCKHEMSFATDFDNSPCKKCEHFAASDLVSGDYWDCKTEIPEYEESNPYAGR